MPANRLHEADAYLTECVTDVTGVQKEKGKIWVTLTDSIFHAQGGGQPADRGTIDGIEVLDVREQEGELLHELAREPEKTEGVVCCLDWEFRYTLMQQHTGQHILSAVIEHLFDDMTTIFRGEDFVGQIDLERPLSWEEIEIAQREANALAEQARAVNCFSVTPEELPHYLPRMRHKVTPHAVIRLVEIEDYDLIGCGGSHVRTTDEVGRIQILNAKNIAGQKGARGELRLYFVCGRRAIEDYEGKTADYRRLEALLGCGSDAVVERVTQLTEQAERAAETNRRLEERLLHYEVESLFANAVSCGGRLLVRATLPDRDQKELKTLCEQLVKEKACAVALKSETKGTIPVVLSQPKGYSSFQMNQAIKSLLETGGKGGGGPIFAQATLPADDRAAEAAEACFDAVEQGLAESTRQ
ncbi:MAG: alanyl-tRNA editing protein [Clostridia bacterium]|nr:alanyl-tRNA editing protein [Clostridia bacterium]